MDMLKIAVIEDHIIFRLGVRYVLKQHFKDIEFFEVGLAEDFKSGMIDFRPELILMGLNSANRVNAFVLFEELKETFPETPIIIFDVVADYNHAVRFMRGQAHGYLSKMDDEQELLNCIDAVMHGRNYVCHEIQENIIQHMVFDKPPVTALSKLSQRESEIAHYIIDGAKTSEIARRLGLKSSTVSTLKSKIYTKFEVSNAIELREKMKESNAAST